MNSAEVLKSTICSLDFPDENEVLFEIGTAFEITGINYNCEHYLWYIQIRPSMEVAQHNREYEHCIRQH
jgi:hypothetical protein